MKHIKASFNSELIKLKRSKIVRITAGIFIFIPAMVGLMMFLVQNPELSAKLGIIGTKAKLFAENDWQGYLTIINQIIATIGLIGFGFITSWVFGREYLEGTLTDIMALPVSRVSLVTAKFLIVLLWCLTLIFILFITAVIIGLFIEIPGFSIPLLNKNIKIYLDTALLTLLLSTPVAFFACYGRGIIAPLGFVIISLITAQFAALSGLGSYFPWAVPGINTVPEGTEGMQLYASSYIIVALTSVLGYIATIVWWKYTDHH